VRNKKRVWGKNAHMPSRNVFRYQEALYAAKNKRQRETAEEESPEREMFVQDGPPKGEPLALKLTKEKGKDKGTKRGNLSRR